MDASRNTAGQTGTTNDPTTQVRREYSQLRRLAARKMASERCDHLLTATALANEVSIRMLKGCRRPPENRDRFLAWASTAMGNVLIDHARAERCRKRGGGRPRQKYEDDMQVSATSSDEIDALTEALSRLQMIDSRRARVVRLRYLEGLSSQETASRLNVSVATVKRDWEGARSWLQQQLSRD